MSWFGNQTSGALALTIEGAWIGAEFTCPKTALVSGLVALLIPSSTSKTTECMIYHASANGMGLVAQTTVVNPSSGIGWKAFPFASTSNPILVSGRSYIFATWGAAGTGTNLGHVVSGSVRTRFGGSVAFSSGAAPVSISGSALLSGSVSIYAWYTETADTSGAVVGSTAKKVKLARLRDGSTMHSRNIQYVRPR